MLGRLIWLIKARANKELSALETPEVLAEEALNEVNSSIKKTQDALIASKTNEKMLEAQIKKQQQELAQWENRAKVAVGQNNDDLARQCLQKKQELAQSIEMLGAQANDQKAASQKLNEKLNELQEQLRSLTTKAQGLTARSKASDATTKANQLLSEGAGSDLSKIEMKIQEKEARAAAEHEMNTQSSAPKIDQLAAESDVEDELASLKAKISPKLIVDQDKPQKTIVDENVPMVVEEIDDEGKEKK